MKKTILGMFLVGMLVLVGCQAECPDCICPKCEEKICPEIKCEECPEEKALLDWYFHSWGENLDNPDEIIFGGELFNYGYIEAKEVILECSIWNELNGKKVKSIKKNVGNFGSTSTKIYEIIIDYSGDVDENNRGYCIISSCIDCEILPNRIPEFMDRYK